MTLWRCVMYLVYLFKEKKIGKVIYVGSSSRPAARMKEHCAALRGDKKQQKIHLYMNKKNLELYKDVDVIWCDVANDKKDMEKLEETYYFKYLDSGFLLNDRPGEDRSGNNNPKRRGVINKSDGRLFKTISEAANTYGIPRTTLSGYLNGRRTQPKINGVDQDFEYLTMNV